MKNARLQTSETSAPEQRHSITSDLFPDTLPPVLPAAWPTIGTRPYEALCALLQGPQNQADYRHGWRLAAYIDDLKSLGWSFLKRDILRPGCRREIREYDLNRKDPAVIAALQARQGGSHA